MMAPECCFILPTGHKCRCVATRHQPFCRHHGSRPAEPSIPRRLRYSRLGRWSQLSRELPHLSPSALPGEIQSILGSLLEDGIGGISDREAGRLLRGLLRRLGKVPFDLGDTGSASESQPAHRGPAVPHPGACEPGTPDPGTFDPQLLDALLAALMPDPATPQRAPVTSATAASSTAGLCINHGRESRQPQPRRNQSQPRHN